ncbi:GrpE-domain-containing protein [Peziza echinospora]|nr:GrpE-domain-containing protein [Peziza echinospora]
MFRRAIQQTAGFRVAARTPTYGPSTALRIPSIALGAIRRPYSTEPGKEDGDKAREVNAENGNGNGNGKSTAAKTDPLNTIEELNKCKTDVEAKTKEAADFKDKFLRSVAEFRNLQDRTEREVRQAKDFAIQKFAKDLVESVDNMDLALSAVPEASRNSTSPEHKDLVDLYKGLRLTEKILLNTLKKHGLEKLNPLGEKFDPNMHEATFQARVEGKEPGTVFHVQRTGFTLNGRILRAAQVGIVQAAP